MKTGVHVRPAGVEDMSRFLELVDALADYVRLPRPVGEARDRLREDAMAQPPRFQLLLGELDGVVVGYGVYFFSYSTFLAWPSLYVEDLFVVPEARRKGVGMALLRACAAEAVLRGCTRMDWHVLEWTRPSFRLDGDTLTQFAAGETGRAVSEQLSAVGA